jgi:hypothetical protein
MSLSTLAYARRAFKSFPRSARHVLQLIAGHQNLQTGWAYLSYHCLSEESSLTRRRVMQLVAFLEAQGALEVRRGHGRGHVNFYRVLREEDGSPVPHRSEKKVKSESGEKVKFFTPPAAQKVKSETPNTIKSLKKERDKVVDTKEREKKGVPVSLSPQEDTDRPGSSISPEVARKFGLRYSTDAWPPCRHEED